MLRKDFEMPDDSANRSFKDHFASLEHAQVASDCELAGRLAALEQAVSQLTPTDNDWGSRCV